MTVFPSVQEKARAEIDRVVGSEHPPSLDQLGDMPYLCAVILETFRWCPLTAGGKYNSQGRSQAENLRPF